MMNKYDECQTEVNRQQFMETRTNIEVLKKQAMRRELMAKIKQEKKSNILVTLKDIKLLEHSWHITPYTHMHAPTHPPSHACNNIYMCTHTHPHTHTTHMQKDRQTEGMLNRWLSMQNFEIIKPTWSFTACVILVYGGHCWHCRVFALWSDAPCVIYQRKLKHLSMCSENCPVETKLKYTFVRPVLFSADSSSLEQLKHVDFDSS